MDLADQGSFDLVFDPGLVYRGRAFKRHGKQVIVAVNTAGTGKAGAKGKSFSPKRWRGHLRPIRFMNSMRVLRSVRKTPSMELVTQVAFCFSTPRIAMHRWNASITTATPCGFSASL